MKMCYKCGKRPAVVFFQEMRGDQLSEQKGLCLVCAKESGIKPITDMVEKMGITDDDIEAMSEQLLDIMGDSADDEDDENAFTAGGAATFPFVNNLFSNLGTAAENADTEKAAETAEDKKSGEGEKKEKKKQKRRKYIEQFCTNLTDKARRGELDRIIGRDRELYRTIQILSRRSKSNPCLIGEPGVGKTAIAEGLAIKIANGDIPARLADKEICLLDLTGLVAGTQFRGQFESRIKGLVDEVKQAGNIILFIDEIHNLVGAGDSEGSMNAGNILKPALSRGEIQVIGATTFNEYRKYIEKDVALERRFQPVVIEEPSIEETIEVLKGIKGYYEGYHGVTVSDNIIIDAVRLSERYINDRFLPDKAIDLLDESCSCASLRNKFVDELYKVNKKIAELSEKEENLESDLNNTDYEQLALVKSDLAKFKSKADELYIPASDNKVTVDDLAKVIELWTGIPAVKIKESSLQKLATLEDRLKKKIIGQDEAIKAVANGVRRSNVQITSHRRPASFIFVGPTGVGKTQLVKELASELFDTPETLIRLDMSEYMEKHSVAKLIGAPPGYVGYDEAGQLTEKVRRKPYSVILFDEIEKAHPDVLNILLQILDDGRVTDSQGRHINFENCVIVMTSNAGSNGGEAALGFGKTQKSANKEKYYAALKEFLRPEFLGRVDEIVVFNKLEKCDIERIAALVLDELSNSLADKEIELSYNDKVTGYIADKCDSAATGARDVRKIVRREVEDKIVDLIIAGKISGKAKVLLTAGDSIKITCK